MPLSESDTRAKLIDPAIHGRGWTEDLIRREETAGTIELGEAGTRRQPKGRVDYVLRVKVTLESQPVAVALIEAKAEHLPPTHGLEQAKLYAEWCTRNNRLRSDPYAFKCTAASGRSALLVRDLEEMRDYDLYDVLAELGYGLAPKTRIERADAFTYKHAAWLSTMPSKTAGAIRALAGLQLADLIAYPSRNQILHEKTLLGRELGAFTRKILDILDVKYDREGEKIFGRKFI